MELSDVKWNNELLHQSQKQIEVNVYDLEAWSVLIREAQTKPIAETRPLFEKLVTTFPSTGRYWKIYIELEIKARNFEYVEKLFQRSLQDVLNIELWKLYLAYVKESKSVHPSYKEIMAQAYDYALDKVGMDIQSYSIWSDYINFLKAADTTGYYAEKQKIKALRRVYQRGVVSPMVNIERLWRDYVNFEQSINSATAEKMVGDRGREYMNARRVAKEFEAITRGLNRNRPSIPPTGNSDEQKQIDLWKKYIAWEKSNPLRTEFSTLVTRRVVFAFEQCLLCLGHHPEIWYDAARFLEKSSKQLTEKGDFTAGKTFSDEAATFYERATSTWVKTNMLLVFAYADFEEERLKHDKVHQLYKRFLDIPDIDPTLAYVQYMKFARRAEGMKSARAVFKRSREDPRSKFHVFVAAALMEYYCSKDKNIAFRIFELGLKRFPSNIEYIQYYIDYLSHLNDENSTRALFEQILSSNKIEKEKSVPIWNRFLEFEANNGDIESLMRVEERRRATLGQIQEFEGKQTAMLVDRYKFLNLYPCSPVELKAMGYAKLVKAAHKTYHRSIRNSGLEIDDQTHRMPRPNFSLMVPFKPQTRALPGCQPVAENEFQVPPAVAHLCAVLPPPDHYCGPFVDIDMMINMFKNIQLPETLYLFNDDDDDNDDNGCTTKLFEIAKSVHWTLEKSGEKLISKPPNKVVTKDQQMRDERLFLDSEDEDQNFVPPARDIYRVRQKRKMKISHL